MKSCELSDMQVSGSKGNKLVDLETKKSFRKSKRGAGRRSKSTSTINDELQSKFGADKLYIGVWDFGGEALSDSVFYSNDVRHLSVPLFSPLNHIPCYYGVVSDHRSVLS